MWTSASRSVLIRLDQQLHCALVSEWSRLGGWDALVGLLASAVMGFARVTVKTNTRCRVCANNELVEHVSWC